MRKRIFAGLCALLLAVSMTACGASSSTGDSGEKTESTENALADGTYTADFTTDSDMFHANKACKGKGLLTVKDGKMTFHVSLVSEKIVNLFVGTAEDAAKDGAELLQPTTDTVYYDDGTSEEVYGYDIPVAEVGKEFDLAIYGTKGKWYDHKVKVENGPCRRGLYDFCRSDRRFRKGFHYVAAYAPRQGREDHGGCGIFV